MGEQRKNPIAVIVWVLAGCVVFVVGGLWLTQPRWSAEEWDTARDEEWEEERDDVDEEELRTHDTFEDARIVYGFSHGGLVSRFPHPCQGRIATPAAAICALACSIEYSPKWKIVAASTAVA